MTEFLPISSSGHLILLPAVTGWPDQGLAFDVAAHLGTLIAVVGYFAGDLKALAHAWLGSLATRRLDADARLAWGVLLGTVPVGLVGLAAHDFIAAELRSAALIATTTIGFGVVLWWADARGARARGLATLGLRDIVLIGCAQALALIPGTSRSGITMTAALALGYTRESAARFSFLLSVPVIALASGLEILELSAAGIDQPWGGLAVVVAVSALSALACIHLFLSFIGRLGMAPFACYRFALGAALFLLVV